MSIMAIDAGTTGVTVLVISETGEIVARGYSEFEQHFPEPGWVEQTPSKFGRPPSRQQSLQVLSSWKSAASALPTSEKRRLCGIDRP